MSYDGSVASVARVMMMMMMMLVVFGVMVVVQEQQHIRVGRNTCGCAAFVVF
jgi:hypothetical protein